MAWSWITGGPGHPGLQWCGKCLGDIGHMSPWAWVIENEVAADGALGSNSLCAPRPPEFLRGTDWKHRTSHYGACPLCSMGEHGSEHLAIWCPAVAMAWSRVGAEHGPSPLKALAGEREASFIASSTHGKTTMQWGEGAEWIVQATISPDGPDGADSYAVSTEQVSAAGGAHCVPTWEDTEHSGCWECDSRAHSTRPGRSAPGAPTRDGGPPAPPGRVAAATGVRPPRCKPLEHQASAYACATTVVAVIG